MQRANISIFFSFPAQLCSRQWTYLITRRHRLSVHYLIAPKKRFKGLLYGNIAFLLCQIEHVSTGLMHHGNFDIKITTPRIFLNVIAKLGNHTILRWLQDESRAHQHPRRGSEGTNEAHERERCRECHGSAGASRCRRGRGGGRCSARLRSRSSSGGRDAPSAHYNDGQWIKRMWKAMGVTYG